MSNQIQTQTGPATGSSTPPERKRKRKLSAEAGILFILIGIAVLFEILGWIFEHDTVIGGTSLTGGIGRIWGTVIGMVILGIMTSGFTFLGVDVYYQDIVKGVIIVAAVSSDMYRQRKRRKA
jgi:ABC-type xylose transport system permease subunit